jgi:tetratricopeptide (TPR) repeat protein
VKRVLFLTLLLAVSAPAALAQSRTAKEYFESSRALMQRGDFAGAIAELDKAVALKPDFAQAYHQRAGAKMLSRDFDGALADANKVIELDPNFKPAYQTRAMARFHTGDLDGALEDYDKSIAVGWLMYESYIGRGNVRRAKGDLDGALEDYGAAIALKPKATEAYMNRANARRQKGDTAGAMEDYNTAILNGAPDPASVVARSGVNVVVGEVPRDANGKPARETSMTRTEITPLPDAAIRSDGATTEIDSPARAKIGAAMALSNRGAELMRQGDADGAIEDYNKSIEIYPTAVAYGNRSAALLHKGDAAAALADINKAVELAPRAAVYYYQRASVLIKQGKSDEARKDLARCLELDPGMKQMVDSTLAGLKEPPTDRQP